MSENSLSAKVASSIKGSFNLDNFKKSKNLSSTSVKFKAQTWIPMSEAFKDALQIPGIPMGHISLLRGHSDTGKTTALLEAAVNAQKMGILPVFIITEMKWNWDHAKEMGLGFEEVVDQDTGEIVDYTGQFIFIDREKLQCIEDVAAFIADLLDEQKKGSLPYNLLFLWDSIGSIPARMSIEKATNNNEWAAGAMSTQFGNFINQRIVLSRKESQPYTNTMLAINKVWVAKPDNPMGQPTLNNKNGTTMYFDASLVITFGNIARAGTNKIKATKNGKEVEFAKRTKISCDKNHVTGITAVSKVIMTVHGFIHDDKKALDEYKKKYSHQWLQALGSKTFDVVEEVDEFRTDMFTEEDIMETGA